MTKSGGRLKVGLIGLGSWGTKIARTIREDIPGFLLHRAATGNVGAQEYVGEQCTLHKDWKDLLSNNDIDAVILAIPPRFNREVASVALIKRIPIFIEKPMTTNHADGEAILNLAIQHQCITEVDHIDLFNPGFCRMEKEIQEPIVKIFGRIGAAYEPRSDIKPVWEYAPHFLAAAIALKEKLPVAIKAINLPRETEPFNDPSKEIIRVILDFGDGSDVCIETGNGMLNKERALHVHTQNEIYHYDDRESGILSMEKQSDPGNCVSIKTSNIRSLHSSLWSFEKKIRNNDTSPSSIEMGLNVVKILEASQASIIQQNWTNIK